MLIFLFLQPSVPCHFSPHIPPSHVTSHLYPISSLPQKGNPHGQLEFANTRYCQVIGGQGESDMGYLSSISSPLTSHLSVNSSQQAAPLLWLQLSPVTAIFFHHTPNFYFTHLLRHRGSVSSPVANPGCTSFLVPSSNLPKPMSSPFIKISLLNLLDLSYGGDGMGLRLD